MVKNIDIITIEDFIPIDAWSLYEEMQNKDKCKSCDRKIIDNMITKNGCIWCDVKYHKSKKVIAMKKLEEIQNG